MTATATRPAAETTDHVDAAHENTNARATILGTADHKLIGLLFIGTGLLFLLVSLVTGVLIGVERLDQSTASVLENTTDVLQLYAMERFGLLFLGVIPIFVGLGLYLAPLQVGASTVAFPRAAAAALWAWLLGSGLQLASFGINGGPWGGEPEGVDLWASSTLLLLGALLLASVCIVTTVIGHRAPGMTLRRVPLLSWSLVVAGSIWLVTLPVLMSDLLLILADHANGRLTFGLNSALWGQVHWVLLAPSILMVAIPVLGIAADAIPVHARAPQRWHAGVTTAISAFGILTFGAWARPLLADGPVTEEPLYLVMAALAFLPLLLVFGAFGDTFRQGSIRFNAPVVASLLGLLLLGAALTASVAVAIKQTELAGTTALNGITTAVALTAVLGIIAALGHWSPKLLGRTMPDGGLSISALLVFVGGLTVLAGEVVAGAYDHPLLPMSGELRDTAEAMGIVVLAGTVAATAGVALTALTLLTVALSNREPAGDDPWEGYTLEWATTSPPAEGNFAEVPMVASATPLLDARAPEEDAS